MTRKKKSSNNKTEIVTQNHTIMALHNIYTQSTRKTLTLRIIATLMLSVGPCLSHSTRGSNTSIQRSVPHASHQCLAQVVHFLGIVGSKRCGNGRSIIHPAFELELTNQFGPVRLGSALGHLVPSHVGFVQVMCKINGQLNEKIALGLGVVGVVEPIVKIRLRSEPQHGVRTVLDPKALLPLFHDNSTKGNTRQNISSLFHHISSRQGRSSQRSTLGNGPTVLIPGFCSCWSDHFSISGCR